MRCHKPTPVLELIEAFRKSKVMFTAVAMGIFDRLHGEEASASTLSEELNLDTGATERLLGACTGLGLLSQANGVYTNTGLSDEYLRRESPAGLTGYILYSDRVLYPMWGHLDDAVREGSHRWSQTFGWDGPIFEHFFRTPDARKTFLDGMHGLGLLSSPQVVRMFNMNGFRHLVDLGGATGHLAVAACERYANLRGTVFDLPAVVEHARPYLDASRAASRLTVQAGDFFNDPLPPADLYAMGRILHDWSEDKIRILLTKIHGALPPGGGVLIAEAVLEEDASGPVSGQLQSLNMLVCTEGRERTASEYRALLESCGFEGVEARRTGAPVDAVLAFRKE